MKLGFVGTGTISKAIVKGLLQTDLPIESIIVSPRNHEIANELSKLSDKVEIATDNQNVVDNADIVFLSIRPQIAETVVSELKFRPDQSLISVMAGVEADAIRQWCGHEGAITRAIPLPFVEQRRDATLVYPANDQAIEIFNALGQAIACDTKEQFILFTAGGAVMGLYFEIMNTIQDWCINHDMDPQKSSAFIRGLFSNLGHVAHHETALDFSQLRDEYSTKGGINENTWRQFVAHKGGEAIKAALDSTLELTSGKVKLK